MKTLIPVITATLLCSGTIAARAGEPADKVQREIEMAEEETRRAHAEMMRQVDATASQIGDIAALIANSVPREIDKVSTVVRRNFGSPAKPLILRSTDASAKDQASLEEDLAVMSRILEKAIEESLGAQRPTRTAMGINLAFVPPDSGRPLYLEGHGALFLLQVSFPLLPPPATPEPETAGSADTRWEEARRELYGTRTGPKITLRSNAEPYDEAKVTALKDALFDALKNAANVRNLKPDEFITVGVQGTPIDGTPTPIPPRPMHPPAQGSSEAPSTADALESLRTRAAVLQGTSGGPTRSAVLTMRARKSDIDAFAKGSLTADAFRKRVSTTAYPVSDSGRAFRIF